MTPEQVTKLVKLVKELMSEELSAEATTTCLGTEVWLDGKDEMLSKLESQLLTLEL